MPTLDYDTLLTHVQSLGIPIFDFVNHLRPYGINDEIGHGGAMTVYKSLLRYDSQQDSIWVALKVPNQTIKESSRDRVINGMLDAIRQEIRIMKHLEKHPYIVSLYGITFRDLKPILVVELAIATLSDYLISKMAAGSRAEWETKAKFCYEIAEGIRSLHALDIVHGDIKADNILLFGNPEREKELVSKISDFGYSSTIVSIANGKGTGGTPNFWAPECSPMAPPEMKQYANKPTKDNYSYGLYVWQVATDGEVPYEEMNMDEIDMIKHSDKELLELMELLPEDTPEPFKQVIIGMTQYIPKERMDLMSVKATILGVGELDSNKDFRYAEVKEAFENSMKDLPRNMENVKFKSLQFMSIPLPIKRRLVRTYEVAATKGDPEAAYFLSVCYGSEFGVKLDKTKMISWAIQAAKGGRLEAVKSIVCSSAFSIENLPENRNLLFPWVLETAKAGHEESQFFISQCYEYGICVEKDEVKSEEWLVKCLHTSISARSEDLLQSESALHCASREGNIEAIKFFIQQENMDVNTKDFLGVTPVQLAIIHGNIDVVKLLILEFGADVNTKDNDGRTLIHTAAQNGHVNIMRFLVVDSKVKVNVKDNYGLTPLHLATQDGQINAMVFLIVEFGADANIKDNDGCTPFHLAAQNGHIELVELFVTRFGTNANVKKKNGQTSLHLAAQNGRIDVVRLLVVEFGADVNARDTNDRTPLHLAAQNGYVEIVILLAVEFGANVNINDNNGQTPLHLAASYGYAKIVDLLVAEFAVDVNIKNNYGRTSLYSAAQNGHINTVESLITEFGADINIEDNNGWTPLHSAAENGHFEIVKSLVISFKVDVNVKNNSGQTPLHLAARNNRIETVNLLINELEADVNAVDNDSLTPLIYSVGQGCISVMIALSENPRVDIYGKTEDGQTMLHLAVKYRQETVVKVLVEQLHFDIHAKDLRGQTPVELADQPPIHFGVICNGCKKNPITGKRHKCTICIDFSFCSTCYSAIDHIHGHSFKIVETAEVKQLLVPDIS